MIESQIKYAELHCHSHFSFKEGASSVEALANRASELGYVGLALTDHDNLSGAMQFSHACQSAGIHGIIGAEVTVTGGDHITLLSESSEGYSNLCKLLSLSHILSTSQQTPELDLNLLPKHADGLIMLSGCRKGEIPRLLIEGKHIEAQHAAQRYAEYFGVDRFFIEMQHNLVKGDVRRNIKLATLARHLGLGMVASNNAHYHIRQLHQLHDCLISIRERKSLEETHRERRANSEFFLKSPLEMSILFDEWPDAIQNTAEIAERCNFNLTQDLKYRFPEYEPPEGYSPESYLKKLCYEAARRRYGSITNLVDTRLKEEFRLIKKHKLAGFLLHYHAIVQLARKVMIDMGLSHPEVPLEERPPGRGRGSSVALLIGYLIGLSHIDPLKYDLSLERFLPDDLMTIALDIDLDFPRDIRERLILAIHQEWGWDRAALTGMHSRYKIKGAIRDLGRTLGLQAEQVDQLAKRVDDTPATNLSSQMQGLPGFRDKIRQPGWKDLVRLAPQIHGIPRYIAQHPGGMIISSQPLTNIVPVQRGAIEGRYVCQWDKDDIDAASFVKIDFLALGTLSQLQEALLLIEKTNGDVIDVSRINFEDEAVYDMLCAGDTIGIFQVESAAQMQTLPRIRPRNLTDMAHEVGCVRPGVGVHDGIRKYILRRSERETVTFDHPLEQRALERTLGIVLFQDQLNQLAIDVGGFSPYEADQMRRAFTKKYANTQEINKYWLRFRQGAIEKGATAKEALKIFRKFNGHYMFPEAHAVAFGVTSYQLAWLKLYYPLQFMTALFNQQPMGFWGLETLKEDCKRHGVSIINPDINFSEPECIIENGAIRLGFVNVLQIGKTTAQLITDERRSGGLYQSLSEFMSRTRIKREMIEKLIQSGAFDSLENNRRSALWETGLRYRPSSIQLPMDLPVEQDMAQLPCMSRWELISGEYQTLNMHPGSHLLQELRPYLPSDILSSAALHHMHEGSWVKVAGLVARPLQHPLSKAYFVTLEDEHGMIPLIIWPRVYEQFKQELRETFIMIKGTISRREGTLNVVVHNVSLPQAMNLKDYPIEQFHKALRLPRQVFR